MSHIPDEHYAELVDDFARTLDLDAGLAYATQPGHYSAMAHDLAHLLDLDTGLEAILTPAKRSTSTAESKTPAPARNSTTAFGGLLLSMRRTSSMVSEFDKWPPGEQPTGAEVFAHNERIVPAPPERVWNLLVAAQGWSEFYANAHFVELADPRQHRLRRGSVFRWVTFGFSATSEVDICHRPFRIGWRWWRRGAHGYHIWLLEPHERGTRVVTEETRRGVLPGLMRPIMRPLLWFGHRYWLRQLARQASHPASR